MQAAYDLGIRHIQLVHYIRNPIGDFQTEQPEHNGLTEFGKKVVEECNRLGILVDLAHCTDEAVTQALAVSKVPMVWSHSSVTRTRKPHWTMPAWQARQLSLEGAKAIAAKGGVVGLWALRTDVGSTLGGLRRPAVGDGGLAGRGPRRLRHRHERPGRPGASPTTPTCGASSTTGSGAA